MARRPDYPVCARHGSSRKDSRLRHFFMCDVCAGKWSHEAFADSPSLYDGETLRGHCILCNALKEGVRLRTWYLCDICDRVARSIGRNHVAEKSIIDFWAESVTPSFPDLVLVQNDASALRRVGTGNASGEAPIDFIVNDKATGKAVFAIENKTGRSSISEMSKFQLDVSDCDCILHDMQKLAVPAYVVHAQVLESWVPPTMGFRPVGLWWTDVYQMAEHFMSTDARRDESRNAAYFRKQAFHDITTLPGALRGKAGYALVERFAKDGVPTMYR